MDRRSRLARRAKTLAKALAAEFGTELSDAQAAAVQRTGELLAIAESMRQRFMAGDSTVSDTSIVRLEGAARRALVDLNLPAASGVRPAESLEEYLARATADDDDDEGAQ